VELDRRADCTDPLREPCVSGQQPDSSQMVLHLGVVDLRVIARGRAGDGIAEGAAEASEIDIRFTGVTERRRRNWIR